MGDLRRGHARARGNGPGRVSFKGLACYAFRPALAARGKMPLLKTFEKLLFITVTANSLINKSVQGELFGKISTNKIVSDISILLCLPNRYIYILFTYLEYFKHKQR